MNCCQVFVCNLMQVQIDALIATIPSQFYKMVFAKTGTASLRILLGRVWDVSKDMNSVNGENASLCKETRSVRSSYTTNAEYVQIVTILIKTGTAYLYQHCVKRTMKTAVYAQVVTWVIDFPNNLKASVLPAM